MNNKKIGKTFYLKMAFINIKKNGKFYFPYLITCIFTIAMYYIMKFISVNKGMSDIHGGSNLKTLMSFGSWLVAIFSIIFLFYTNSFLMKRRKREIGLYNILGMEKKHLAHIMVLETIYTAAFTLVTGLLSGVIFSRLVLLILGKVLRFNVRIKFYISVEAVIYTIIIFAGIFILTLFANLISIGRAKPVELLRSKSAGEKEPKTKILLTLAGLVTIGIGYYMAIVTKNPLEVFYKFFIAAILVIIGTYCLFTAGSIAILKILRNNKKYYYQTKHFTSVSGMLYRMKKNAVGLANICILSTMVLVIVSTTVSLYVGTEDALKYRFSKDISYTNYIHMDELDKRKDIEQAVNEEASNTLSETNTKAKDMSGYSYLGFTAVKTDKGYEPKKIYNSDSHAFVIITLEDYNRMTGKATELDEKEILECSPSEKLGESLELFGQKFSVKYHVKEFDINDTYRSDIMSSHYIVVANDDVLENLWKEDNRLYGDDSEYLMQYNISFNISGTDKEKIAFTKKLSDKIQNRLDGCDGYIECRQEIRDEFYVLYGGILFVGIFLGLLFLIITVLIIYYKQITEGYEDKERFCIMQKVGMSRAEVKSSIRSQVLMVFMLPIVIASIHVAAAFSMIKKLLALMNLTNAGLFVECTIATIIIFTIVYAVVYWITSKTYYKIVESK